MKVVYQQAARDDLTRQFRYYMVALDNPAVAVRFRNAVRKTVAFVSRQPEVAPVCEISNPRLSSLRSWPVTGFEAIRLYFLLESDGIRVIRLLHSKRDVARILSAERP